MEMEVSICQDQDGESNDRDNCEKQQNIEVLCFGEVISANAVRMRNVEMSTILFFFKIRYHTVYL